MSSYRYLVLATSVLVIWFNAIDGRSTWGAGFPPIYSFNSIFSRSSNRASIVTQQHSVVSANNVNPCSVLKFDVELKPIDDEFSVCKAKFDSALCDGDPIPKSIWPSELPCGIEPMKCPASQSLPLIAMNSTTHYHADGVTCDFDLKTRVMCDGKCFEIRSGSGTSTCLAPDLDVDVEPC